MDDRHLPRGRAQSGNGQQGNCAVDHEGSGRHTFGQPDHPAEPYQVVQVSMGDPVAHRPVVVDRARAHRRRDSRQSHEPGAGVQPARDAAGRDRQQFFSAGFHVVHGNAVHGVTTGDAFGC